MALKHQDDLLRDLRDSLDADVLRDDYPQHLVEQELRDAGCDPADLVARNRPTIDAMLAARRAATDQHNLPQGGPSALSRDVHRAIEAERRARRSNGGDS